MRVNMMGCYLGESAEIDGEEEGLADLLSVLISRDFPATLELGESTSPLWPLNAQILRTISILHDVGKVMIQLANSNLEIRGSQHYMQLLARELDGFVYQYQSLKSGPGLTSPACMQVEPYENHPHPYLDANSATLYIYGL